MKLRNLLFAIIFLLGIGAAFGQTPQKFNYQAVARDNSGNVLDSQPVGIQISIRQTTSEGTIVYTETHTPTTSIIGLINLSIGGGTVTTGNFSTIDWGAGPYYIEIGMDASGGTSYITIGTQQLLSVPYALFSENCRTHNTIEMTERTGNGAAWGELGNTGTIDGTNFIGTADFKPLNFRVNNQKAGRIDAQGLTFLGYLAGNNNTGIYSYNTGIGYKSLYSNTSGTSNTAIGVSALNFNTTGKYNTANGGFALKSNNTGSYNTANGCMALYSNTAGEYNTALGYGAFSNGTIFSNSMSLGANAISISASNIVRLGNSSITSIGGQVGWTTLSDARVKTNVQENVPGLIFIKELRPVTYYYDVDKENELLGSSDSVTWEGKDDIKRMQFSGFLAQEVDAVANKVGYKFSGVDKSGTLWGLRYAEFTVPLVKAVQEQQEMIENLQVENQKLNIRLEKLEELLGTKVEK